MSVTDMFSELMDRTEQVGVKHKSRTYVHGFATDPRSITVGKEELAEAQDYLG